MDELTLVLVIIIGVGLGSIAGLLTTYILNKYFLRK